MDWSAGMKGPSWRRCTSSGDVPLIASSNAARLKIKGPIDSRLTVRTQPLTYPAVRCSEARIMTPLCRDRRCQQGLEDGRPSAAEVEGRPLVPSPEINSHDLYSSQKHITQIFRRALFLVLCQKILIYKKIHHSPRLVQYQDFTKYQLNITKLFMLSESLSANKPEEMLLMSSLQKQLRS